MNILFSYSYKILKKLLPLNRLLLAGIFGRNRIYKEELMIQRYSFAIGNQDNSINKIKIKKKYYKPKMLRLDNNKYLQKIYNKSIDLHK